jgi:6,7-dimethyl-8-ribityllumazine synthase
MTTTEFQNKVAATAEESRYIDASIAKEIAAETLELIKTIEKDENYAYIYKCEDGFVIIGDTYHEDFVKYETYEGNAEETAKKILKSVA